MELKKLGFFDKLFLKFLGFDFRKVQKWINNKNVLSKSRYFQIKKEWKEIREEIKNFNIKKVDKNSLRNLKVIEKRLNNLSKERDKGDIIFNSFNKFKKFTWWFELIFLKTGFPCKNINHEHEHAKVYWEKNIPCEFGWKKLYDKKRKNYFIPFINVTASDKIHKKSLKAVRNLSLGDKEDLKIIYSN